LPLTFSLPVARMLPYLLVNWVFRYGKREGFREKGRRDRVWESAGIECKQDG